MILDPGRLLSAEWQRRLTPGLFILWCWRAFETVTAFIVLHDPCHCPSRLWVSRELHLCCQLHLKTSITETAYQIHSITGKPISRQNVKRKVGLLRLQVGQLHTENIQLLVVEGLTDDIILGHPWLVRHNPILSWGTGEVLQWGDECFPIHPQSVIT